MSIGTNTPRLLAAAKEFNIGKDTLLAYLEEQGFETKGFKPNSKLSEKMYHALQDEFAKDKAAKRKSDSIALPKGTILDNIDKSKEELDISAKDQKSNPIQEIVEKKDSNTPKDSPLPKETKVEETEQAEKAEATTSKTELKNIDTPLAPHKQSQTTTPEPKKSTTTSKAKPKEIEVEKSVKKGKKEETNTDSKTEGKSKPKQDKENTNSVDEEEDKKNHIEVEPPRLSGPKVLDKINLDTLNLSTRPKKDTVKKTTKTSKSTEKGKEAKTEKPVAEKVEFKISLPPEVLIPKKEKASDGKNAEQEQIEHIQTKLPKLEGPRVIGKIELPTIKSPSRQESGNKKRKRKRIPVDKKHDNAKQGVALSKKGKGRVKGQSGKGGKKDNNVPQEIDAKEIQEKIRQTQAKLAGGGARSKNLKAKYRRNKREERAEKRAAEERANEEKVIQVTEFISVSEFANLLEVNFAEVISKCMSLGIMVSINQRLDAEVIELVASEFETEVEFINLEDNEEEEEIIEEDLEEDLEPRAPVITIMGHVDHGKTSLLDYIRRASVVAGEAGGITQHIGAYKVITTSGKDLTFLDTPGHEAFTAMRARGAKAADIAIIVIAADDAIMPQTKEAISHAQAANLPMVFAINKIDKEGANPDKIKEQLSAMNILVEDWGGKYQCQEISAKKGLNIDTLLEKILLESELLELKANPDRSAVGTVIEASLDKGRGYVSTVLVQTGTLHLGEMIVCGQYFGKIKAMTNERGQKIDDAGPSTPVQILGLNGAPQAGEKFKVYEDETEAKSLATHRAQILREQGLRSRKHITLDEIGRRLALGNFKELNVIIKADYDGSAEAISDSLQKLSTEEIVVNVVLKGVGQIKESDIMLASASDAIIIGFQVRPSIQAARIAEQENIEIRQYSIIYDAIAEIKSAMEGMLEPKFEKKVVGNIEVRETYKISKLGTIAGCYVLDGKFTRNTKINIIRDGIVVHAGELASLKRYKDDVKEVNAGYECGLTIKGYNDIKAGDILEGYEEVEIKRKL